MDRKRKKTYMSRVVDFYLSKYWTDEMKHSVTKAQIDILTGRREYEKEEDPRRLLEDGM